MKIDPDGAYLRRGKMWRVAVVLALVLGAAGSTLVPRTASAQEMDTCYDLRMGRMGCIGVWTFNFVDPTLAENSRHVAWRAYVRNSEPRVMTAEPTNRPGAVALLSAMSGATRPGRYSPPGPLAPVIIPPSTDSAPAASVVLAPGVPSPRDEISVHGSYPMDSARHDYCIVYSRGC
jgi:hypothetical protein